MNRIMGRMWAGIALFLSTLFISATSLADMPSFQSSYVGDEQTPVWHDSLNSGWEESRRRGVPMVIYITSDRCQYCEAMKRDTWCDAKIRKQLANGFVAIRLTPHDNAQVLNRIDVSTYPMTLIGVPQGKIIDHRVGYQPPRSMHKLLSKIKRR